MSQKTQEYAQQVLSQMVFPDMPAEDGLRLVQSNMARAAMPAFAEGGEVENQEPAPDVGRPTVAETQLAKTVFPDLPVAEAVYMLRGGQRQSTPQGEMLMGNIGASVPLGKDANAMLMLAGSRPERDMSESKALMAAFNKRVGDEGGLNVNLVRPLDAPAGIYAGGVSGSYPLGEGRVMGNVNALKLPGQDPRITGYGVGYGGRVGPGNLSAQIMKQKDGPYSGQIEYRMPIGRAEGGEVERLTPQQIERLAEKNVKLTGINKVIDFVAQRVDPQTKGLPTSARTLLETVQGGRSRITEANFSPEEIEVMRQLAELKGGDKGAINYADYIALAGEMNKQGKMPASMSPSLLSMADPMGNVQTTLGRFRYQRDPKGNLQISDTYDFNPPNPNATQEARTGDYGAFGVYGLIRDYAGERIPPGMGRDVRVNLPPAPRTPKR